MLRIFLPLYLILFFYVLLYDPLTELVLYAVAEEEVMEDAIGDFQGAFYLIEEVLKNSDETAWPEHLENMSAPNIPIRVVTEDELALSESGKETLDRNEILVVDVAEGVLVKRLEGTRWIIHVGPVETVESLTQVFVMVMLGGTLLLMLLVLLWAFTVQRRIAHLSRVTRHFGQGDLSVRASVAGRLKVGRLNDDFNRMAVHIQNLIESHKHLTNAVSHELRTPISRIRFELDFAQTLEDPADLHASFDSIAEDTQELEKMVEELLSYAKFERATLELALEEQPLASWLSQWHHSFLQQQERLLQEHSKDKHLNIELLLPEQDRAVPLNSDAMSRALDNLVLNAARYAHAHVRIQLLWISEGGQSRPCIRVEDDGPGVPENYWKTLFDPFVRADKSRNRGTGGFGLGLAIVAQIARRHNGEATIGKSTLGGACFSVCWKG